MIKLVLFDFHNSGREQRHYHHLNRLFPSSETSHFQNEAKFKSILVKMNCICMRIKKHIVTSMFSHLAKLEAKYSEIAYFHLIQYEVQLIVLKLISGSSDCTYFHINTSKLSKNNWYQPRVYEDIDGNMSIKRG